MEERKKCIMEIKKLVKIHGDKTVYNLEELYERFGCDVVNSVREELRGKVIGM